MDEKKKILNEGMEMVYRHNALHTIYGSRAPLDYISNTTLSHFREISLSVSSSPQFNCDGPNTWLGPEASSLQKFDSLHMKTKAY